MAAALSRSAPCKALGMSGLQGHPELPAGATDQPRQHRDNLGVIKALFWFQRPVKPICVVNMVGVFISHNRRKRPDIFPCVVSSDLGVG